MSLPKLQRLMVWRSLLLLGAMLAVLVMLAAGVWWFAEPHRTANREALQLFLTRTGAVWGLLFSVCVAVCGLMQAGIRERVQQHMPPSGGGEAERTKGQPQAGELRDHLRNNYGYLWRRHVRLLLVVGETDEIEAVAPGLADQNWQEGQGTVLLWGGSLKGQWQSQWPESLRRVSWRRPLDGVVWALTSEQRGHEELLGGGVRRLQTLARGIRWQAPLYLWQVTRSQWQQDGHGNIAAGCLLRAGALPAQVEKSLEQLVAPLRERGLSQLDINPARDFFLRLSRDLSTFGIREWRNALVPLMGSFSRGVPLRGLLFSLPLKPAESTVKHSWWPAPAWDAIREDGQAQGGSLGWSCWRGLRLFTLGLASFCILALLLSYTSNRSQIATVDEALTTIDQPDDPDAQLSALYELTRELSRLDYRREHGVPWYQRLGLSQNDALLAALWPRYAQANNRLMRDVVAQDLEVQLAELAALPADSPRRASRAEQAHDQLKAYLMMARPERVDAAFLAKVLIREQPERPGVSPGLWQGLSPGLWAFYAQHLAAHPDWRTETKPGLVAQVRHVLLGQLGQRNGMANLYQQVLDRASNNFAAMMLIEMVGETDATSLFDTPNSVPGMFTRQAWEGQVSKAIDEIAEARREEIDWVLSDQQSSIDSELQPEVLKAKLTERYFQDFSDAWLAFLNSIRWRKADNLSDAISQLTLLSDVRQSPLIALMNTLAYQGKTDMKSEALSDSLMRSAQQLLDSDKQPAIEQKNTGPRGPLDNTFGPILGLLGKEKSAGASAADNLRLQAFLTRVTRVRLKLQQVTNAPNPQAMTQALAQTVFKGTSVDLTDTLDYGSLIAASLGAEWSGFGQSLFVQPLNQAWEGILQPSAQGLNQQWQRSIVDNWNRAFVGRYPFDVSGSDASLPMLGQMIRAGSGRIDQFISNQLGGVLRKEGNRWVADSTSSQGLHFNPAFLEAVNQLSELADILYTDGGMGITFQLQAKPVRNVVQTTLILDGVTLEYFNQVQNWQRFVWPRGTDHPGASLSWTSIKGGARLFGDYSGIWGLIRLFEQAKVTPLDDRKTLFELVLSAPDELPLTWQMRTELGNGPLELLELRGFTLPANIFVVGTGQADPYAAVEPYE